MYDFKWKKSTKVFGYFCYLRSSSPPMKSANPKHHDEIRIPGLEQAFAEILRTHRRAHQWSQEELALQTGLDRTFLSLMELGLRRPSLTTVFLFAQRFGIPPAQLVQEIDDWLNNHR